MRRAGGVAFVLVVVLALVFGLLFLVQPPAPPPSVPERPRVGPEPWDGDRTNENREVPPTPTGPMGWFQVPVAHAQFVPGDCATSLQTRINNATAGNVLYLPPCIYRETVTVNKALTLSGAGPVDGFAQGTEIRGSDVWTGWSGSGPWTHTDLPALDPTGPDIQSCQGSTESRCNHPQQVFYDGVPLLQRDHGVTPGAMQFSVNGGTVTIGSNPNGHTVEVTTRRQWMIITADNVTVQRMRMVHAANFAQDGALKTRASKNAGAARANNTKLLNNVFGEAHGAVLTIAGTDASGEYISNPIVKNNEIYRGGNAGIACTNVANARFEGNYIHHHNTESFNTGWEAGGIKCTVMSNMKLIGNEISFTDAPGMWCDIYCGTEASLHGIPSATAFEASYNYLHNNAESGIFFEISTGAIIHHNIVWNNSHNRRGTAADWLYGGGIFISSSKDTKSWENVVAWNADGLTFVSQPDDLRGGTCPSNNFPCAPQGQANKHVAHDNWVFQTELAADSFERQAMGAEQDWGSPMFGSVSVQTLNGYGAASGCTIGICYTNNKFYWTQAEGSGRNRYSCNAAHTTLAAFNGSSCAQGADSTTLTTGERDTILNRANVPTTPPATPSLVYY